MTRSRSIEADLPGSRRVDECAAPGTRLGGPARESRGCQVARKTRQSASRAFALRPPRSPRGRGSEDRPASPAAAKSLMKGGTPQVGPAPVDGVSPQFFGALVGSGSVAFAASLRKTKD